MPLGEKGKPRQKEAPPVQWKISNSKNAQLILSPLLSGCSLPSNLEYRLAAIFHQPFRRGSGAANTDTARAIEPFPTKRRRRVYEISTGIDATAGLKENAAVAAFEATHEDDDIVAHGKIADIRQAIGHLSADGVVGTECGRRLDVRRDIVHNLAEPLQRFGGLREKTDVACEVEFLRASSPSITMAVPSVCPTRPSTSA